MTRPLLAVLSLLVLTAGAVRAEKQPVTPPPGSEVRKAICNAMRLWLRYAENLSPEQANLKWKVAGMQVLDDYAAFQGYPVDADGQIPPYIPDMEYSVILKQAKPGAPWEIIYNLSRTDVPSAEELSRMRENFPEGVPVLLIPEYWREKLIIDTSPYDQYRPKEYR